MHLADCGRSRFRSPTSPIFCVFAVEGLRRRYIGEERNEVVTRNVEHGGRILGLRFSFILVTKSNSYETRLRSCRSGIRLKTPKENTLDERTKKQ